jgi:undecaprenyl-diphosphatase
LINAFQAIILGIVQGATEFIPVSSSGHLVLVPWLLGWPKPGLAFDTVLHLGTLLAVLLVFWRDLFFLANAWLRSLADHRLGADARLAWWVLLATLPAAAIGALLESRFQALFSSPQYVALFLLVTGAWLVVTERARHSQGVAQDLAWWQSLLIGVAQGVAIAPGISRSGATIGAGMALGLRREESARFSFLLAVPIIFGAGLLQSRKLLAVPNVSAQILALALGFLAAFVTGYACIRFLLAYVRRHSLLPFACYCWLIGLAALAVAVL